jgi:lysozyme
MSPKQRIAAGLLGFSALGVTYLIQHEGMVHRAYVDPVGVVTVCAGHTATAKLGQVHSAAVCADLLKSDVKTAEAAVKRLVLVPITQSQYDSLVSLVFNIGTGAFQRSTLLREVNAGRCMSAGKQFSRWVYGGGRILPGLVTRRADERRLWESGCVNPKAP